MTPEDFRSAVFSDLQAWQAASYPAMPVVYENGPEVDEDSIGLIWLDVEIRWYGGQVASMGTTPRTRSTGALSLDCYYRSGQGTSEPWAVAESLSQLLGVRRIGSAVLGAPQRKVPTNLLGWYKAGLLIPFTLG